ncbi:DUF5925 domain-containing protein [Catellatospora sp. KI3]|uniref:DUF5925 domain-containing protein n=1 Tax=Catellatospora sp. KI3 TaxID=3041620 RepID=UPI002482A584|nr:DUF5925 domain-containing protein [Catellatospora sp. KI3]MDI1462414.1 DUF5925 domain-containing protein [Catellatospora sp. KI3]
MGILSQLPTNLTLDDADTPRDIVDAMILAPFSTGDQPYAHTARLPKVRKDAPLLPADGHVLRVATDDGLRSHLAAGDGWTLRAARWRGGVAEVTVTATSEELALRILEDATRGARDEHAERTDSVSMGFWHHSAKRGAQRSTRPITTPSWAAIRDNYAGEVAASLERLMTLTPDSISGRLLLLHGVPGTGKTTALRALAQAWSSWCQVDCVLDPENLFHDSSYLMEVAIGDDEHEERRWRLLLVEDCDELISSAAKASSGQALSRLLNLTDGLLAQGRDVLVGLTTNEPLARLHPAVVRPGRCLAQIEVGPLPFAQASAWLGTSVGLNPSGATLAELFALQRGDRDLVPHTPEPATGCYL